MQGLIPWPASFVQTFMTTSAGMQNWNIPLLYIYSYNIFGVLLIIYLFISIQN